MKKITVFFSLLLVQLGFSQNLITNGNFESGSAGWSGNALNVVVEGGNSYNAANVTAAGNPWDVNLSYVLPLGPVGKTYNLKFDAFSDTNRILVAGIGLNQSPFTSVVQTVNLTPTSQTFNLTLVASFESATSRIIFDMGNATGFVGIDNVELTEVPTQLPLIQDFENASTFNFAGFEGLASAAVVADPVSGGTRGNGFQLTNQTSGNPWQGAEIVLTTKRVKLTTNKTMQVDVYSTQAFNLLAKVEVGAPASATSQAYTTPGQWQTLTFSFTTGMDNTGVANGEYQKIVFFGNWNATNTGFNPPANFAFHVDNIRAEEAAITPDPEPTTAAPTPPNRAAADVRSIFSDAYQPVAVMGYTGDDNTYNNSWCGGITSLVSIQGNPTNKVTGLGCEGVTFLSGRFDATSFTHFHIDFWTPTATQDKSFNVKFSNWNGGAGEANAIELSMTNANLLTNPNPGTWYSIDVPLSSFTPINGANRNDLVQFVITSDLGTVYYDNVYLHKNTVLNNAEFEATQVKVFPNPAESVLNIQAANVIEKVTIVNIMGQTVFQSAALENTISLDVAGFQPGMYIVKTTVNGIESSRKFLKK
ncbi:Por secretion system C-terminal sorting domain-containing protein [Flavobacterium fontis]|uniref:Por secretion system C-terminal sorting domain-containing protein n=1 Tax=Flavobacterium fontis TaxID=1124188 RepID=A0A1M5AK74_9FLAO|nr:carbohydrate binding domain-containing protein [Flavobacterium fontis]SHF30312.1 Por secretion system C-terminal sorting domain-containing protein [Flavobacterium fontis]